MRKVHKYTGLFLLPVIFLLVVSGIILNHREAFSPFDLSRSLLPPSYRYSNWNYGFFKGACPWDGNRRLLYGAEGVWLSCGDSTLTECNRGIDAGADQRKIHRVIRTAGRQIFAVSSYRLYRLDTCRLQWHAVKTPAAGEAFVDVESRGDTLVLLSRSRFFTALQDTGLQAPVFTAHQLPAPVRHDIRQSLFRWTWDLHSGALWGTTGRIAVDIVGLLFLFVSATGVMIWLCRHRIRYSKSRRHLSLLRQRFSWYHRHHDKWGYALLLPFLVIALSGAFLRPPLLLLLTRVSVASTGEDNPWEDRLRTLRYDPDRNYWLLYTSEGMFRADGLHPSAGLHRLSAPPVSVMGLNVMEKINPEEWIIGSFSGLYRWNPEQHTFSDVLCSAPSAAAAYGLPFSDNKVSGLVFYAPSHTLLFDYDRGVRTLESGKSFLPMPEAYAARPMSLWHLALEIHTGRIFTFLGLFTLLLPFLWGILALTTLFSGWKISRLKGWSSTFVSTLFRKRRP